MYRSQNVQSQAIDRETSSTMAPIPVLVTMCMHDELTFWKLAHAV